MGKRVCEKPPDALQTSQGDGHDLRGKRTTLPHHEFHQWNFLQDPRNMPPPTLELGIQSTRTTKFTTGFYRRTRTAIAADRERLARQAVKERAATSNAAGRHERLTSLNSSYDYNIVTGAPGQPKHAKLPPCRTYLAGHQSSFLKHEGAIQLRESSNRFYSAWPENHLRADNLTREGLLSQKQSSAIGVGRNEIKSDGAADALSKSLYKQCVEQNTRIKLEYTHAKKLPAAGGMTWLPPVAAPRSNQSDIDSVRALR
ncbi:hypothetical protein LEN26_017464 [Aphanomyces euteiches]|nr:hypothetical protein LEN26_017464 [Aphanomyces euteiches]KAH9127840.1 hypothetical protein AeMF1_001916 [Aphanomyces euteiches]